MVTGFWDTRKKAEFIPTGKNRGSIIVQPYVQPAMKGPWISAEMVTGKMGEQEFGSERMIQLGSMTTGRCLGGPRG